MCSGRASVCIVFMLLLTGSPFFSHVKRPGLQGVCCLFLLVVFFMFVLCLFWFGFFLFVSSVACVVAFVCVV